MLGAGPLLGKDTESSSDQWGLREPGDLPAVRPGRVLPAPSKKSWLAGGEGVFYSGLSDETPSLPLQGAWGTAG